MHSDSAVYSRPSWRLTNWLAEAPAGTPDDVRVDLLSQMFGSLPVFIGGICATLLLPVVVNIVSPRPAFLAWLIIELLINISRLVVLVHARRAAALGRPTASNLHVLLSLAWSASVGLGGLLAIMSGDWMLATLVCVPAAAMVGGICFRNFPTPRLASVMMLMSLGPISLGAALSGHEVMIVVAALLPLYIISMTLAAYQLNRMLVTSMVAERENGHRARHDDLTGLANRANLTSQMNDRLRRAGRDQSGHAVLYLDLDGFKRVNDTHGHATGDRVLQMVADRLNALVRIGDVTARLGGDEFVVLIDSLTEANAVEFAERLVTKIARTYDVDGIPCEIGVSVGIACSPQHGTDVRMLLAAADAALYSAKALGRCRVALATVPQTAINPLAPPLAPDDMSGDLAPRQLRAST
ncbi:GGDEF domain-containing protein [Phreatobacter aquaticus]|uniref:GGDEF domain-containing protein n=1 Tax=Phreatobacter aquaticus TaxID=2570229 RepID=A0A4D7QB94_9HYPH|nr:GGDEF domain-containing protein [Phreatobacter aquaticus]QCK84448.1 GGDEF domain-containing protein [Phreatobacter aquaticus]